MEVATMLSFTKPLKRKVKQYVDKRYFDTKLVPYVSAGHVSIAEGRFLMSLVQECNKLDGPLIEIGTLFGYSTQIIILSKNSGKKLYTVDNFRWNPVGLSKDEHMNLTKLNLKESMDTENVQLCIQDKDEFYKNYNDKIPSLIFIDADHSYEGTKEDLVWAKEMNIKYICGHDYSEEFPGIIEAVNEVNKKKPAKVVGSIFLFD